MSDKKVLEGNFGREELERQQSTLGGKVEESVSTRVPKVDCVETVRYDENGEVIVDTVRKIRSKNGSGFVISYTAKMLEFIESTRQGSVVRLFLYLAHNQNYGTEGKTFGYRCSHKFLQQVLGLDRKSVYNAIAYLKEKFLLIETSEDGSTEFMVNPNYVTIGADKKARMRVWNERWEKFFRNGGSLTPSLFSKK